MDAPFPFGFPTPTAFYLVAYVLTLLIHVIFMNYVFAGSAYVFVESLADRRHSPQQLGTPGSTLRDWLPFALSAAITAGVAPLLFLQVLYKNAFYTANLLLFHRWMVVVPVLMIGFYLLYLLKANRRVLESRVLRVLVSFGAFACIAFTGYSWSENHQLSLDSESWPRLYAAGAMGYHHTAILPRVMVWLCGSLPTMCLMVACQLRLAQRHGVSVPPLVFRRLAGIAFAGLGLAAVGVVWWYAVADERAKSVLNSKLAIPYLLLALPAAVLHLVTWIRLWISRELTVAWLACGWISLLATMLGMTVVRECVRLTAVDMPQFFEQHNHAFQVGGFRLFAMFLLVNTVLIGWCVRLVVRGLRPSQAQE